MRHVSETTYAALAERVEPLLVEPGASAVALGEQLFSVVDLLDGSGSLRRALSDPGRDGERRAALAERLLGGKADDAAVAVVAAAARTRWSDEAMLADALERLAADAMLAAAQAENALEQVEDELFRFDRLLVGERALREALTDRRATAQARGALVRSVLGGKVHPVTLGLVERAAAHPRGRSVPATLNELSRLAAHRRQMLVATVTAAAVPSRAQLDRLRAVLARTYGRTPRLNVAVDPALVGGMRVQVGPEVVDATMAARLQDVRRRLAG